MLCRMPNGYFIKLFLTSHFFKKAFLNKKQLLMKSHNINGIRLTLCWWMQVKYFVSTSKVNNKVHKNNNKMTA